MQMKKTINEKELEILNFWEENQIFEKSVARPQGALLEDFSFYDGPPFATGLPHHGHILAGTIKDSIPRYQTMRGKNVRRVWGWDCHGLPIENLVEKEFGLNSKKDIEVFGIDKFNKAASDSVLKYESEWKKIVPRLGRWVDMNKSYKTMDWTFTESVWWVWKSLYDKGLAYEGSKMMHICPRCETSLAQSEVNMPGAYKDISDISVIVPFELEDKENDQSVYILAWTTTPWTLPGNSALAVNRNIDYVKLKLVSNNIESYFIIAKRLLEKVFKDSQNIEVSNIDINDYIGKKYKQLFPIKYPELYEGENKKNAFLIWHADFITDEAGTGIAHEAPAFGAEDMDLAKQNNIPFVKHVQMNGEFTELTIDSVFDYANEEDKSSLVKVLQDLKVKKKGDSISTDVVIIKWLAHNGKLFNKEKLIHSYPHCWRCDTPLLNYATSSWFVDVPKIKDKLIFKNKEVNWIPEHVKDGRFGKWLEGAREWAVSRSRYWGAPLPIWKSVDGSEIKVIGSLNELAENNAQKPNNIYYTMRHGESYSNINKVFDSGNDKNNHLTDNGKGQVHDSIAKFDDQIDIIISSPVLRTKETAEIVSGYKNIDVIFDERLREINVGVYDNCPIQEYLDNEGDNYLKLDHKIKEGETHRDVMNRVLSLLLDLENKYNNKKILIVTHGGPIRMLVAGASLITEEVLLKDDSSLNPKLYPKNAEIFKLDYKVVPRDETGRINLHKPYIDKVVLKDSKGQDMKIIGDVFDCWFESGSMPYGQLHYPFENKELFDKNFPADFIAEGMDQTRGWFYSLINLGVGLFDKPPYKNVIVNGIVLAGDGQKMSKSLKNYTDPMILVEKFGADAIRFALMNSPVMRGEAISFTDEMVEEVYKKNIVRLENIVEFYQMYNINSSDNNILKDINILKDNSLNVSGSEGINIKRNESLNHFDSESILDSWIKIRLQEVINISVKGYENYELDIAVSSITEFIDDLSTWYLRRSRDRLKSGDIYANETLKYILIEFSKVIAPSMPFLAERIYKALTLSKESVHLDKYPDIRVLSQENQVIILDMQIIRNVVADLLMLRQKANVPVRQPLTSATINKIIPQHYFEIIKEEINIKTLITDTQALEYSLDLNITSELKTEGQEREWIRKINDERKKLGLVHTDKIKVFFQKEDEYVFVLNSQNIKSAVNIDLLQHSSDLVSLDNNSISIVKV